MTFLVALDTRPAMLLNISRHVSDRSLAFAVLDKIDAAPGDPLCTVTEICKMWVRVDRHGVEVSVWCDLPF